VNLEYSDYVEVSQKYFRPNEVKYLLGDSSKAKKELNWKPNTSFQDLVKMMIEHDIRIAKSEKILLDEGLLEPSWEN
jgi:GDPmannose 4,6-dehydratase